MSEGCPEVNSGEGDQNSVGAAADVTIGTTPTPALCYRFAPDLWDRAGFSFGALQNNRLGRLAYEQDHLVSVAEGAVGLWLSVGVAVSTMLFGLVWLGKAGSATQRVAYFFIVLLGLGLLMLVGRWLWLGERDVSQGRVDSFCGELTKWKERDAEGDPYYGLRHGSFEVRMSSEAYAALPMTAHYRIYFSPRVHAALNVEEHAYDAPHEVPSRHESAASSLPARLLALVPSKIHKRV